MKNLILITLVTIFTSSLFGQYQIEYSYYKFENGKFIESDGMWLKNSYTEKYNADSLLTDKTYKYDGSKTTYEYNDKKQKIAVHEYDTNGKLTRTGNYTYTSKGFITLIESNFKRDKDSLLINFREEYGYKKTELITKVYVTNQFGIESVFNYETTYEGKQKKVAEHHINFGRDAGTEITYFNENGLEIKVIKISGEDLLKSKPTGEKTETTFEYEFDKNGVWTKKKSYRNGVLLGEIRRTIIK